MSTMTATAFDPITGLLPGQVVPAELELCSQRMALGGPELGFLRPSNDLLGKPGALAARLAEDGYLFMRGLIAPERIMTARERLLSVMAANDALDPSRPRAEAPYQKGKGGLPRMSHEQHPEVMAALEAPELFDFFRELHDGAVITYPFKWLRAVEPGGFTGAHVDKVYMGRGTPKVTTCWIPLGDVSYAEGGLAVMEGSHRAAGLERVRKTYGEMDVDRDHVTGWFSNNPRELNSTYQGGRWLTSAFHPGDFITFGLMTMHASIKNTSRNYRISCDVRFQRADAAVDERWVGEKPMGHYAWQQGKTVSMDDARKQWGIAAE